MVKSIKSSDSHLEEEPPVPQRLCSEEAIAKEGAVKPDAFPSALVPIPPDGGYGWVIVAVAFMNNFIIDGIAYAYGVLMLELLHSFDTNKAKVSLIGSLLCGIYLASGPISGAIVNRYDCRITTFIGAIVSCLAFFISSFAPSVDMLLVFFGGIGGLGFGLIYLPSIVIVSHYFSKRRSTAVGIATCGTGFGAFVGAPFMSLLLQYYDWSNAVRILAGILLNCAVFGALMKPLELPEVVFITKDDSSSQPEESQALLSNHRQIPVIQEDDTAVAPTVAGAGNADKKRYRHMSENCQGQQRHHSSTGGNTTVYISSLPDISYDRTGRCPAHRRVVQVDVRVDSKAPFLLPPNVTREDYARPMYRKDIFFSGSRLNLERLKQAHQNRSHKASMSVDEADENMEDHPHDQGLVGAELLSLTDPKPDPSPTRKRRLVPKLVSDILKEMTDFSLLRHGGFLLIFLSCLVNVGFWVPSFYLPDLADYHHISTKNGALLLAVMGAANMLARFSFNTLANMPWASPLLINNVTLLLSGLVTFIIPVMTTFPVLMAYAIAYGILVAANISLTSPILCNLVGVNRLTNAFGLIGLARGVSSLVGPPLAGIAYDISKDVNAPFLLSAVVIVASAILFFLVHIPRFQIPPEDDDKQDKV